MLWVAIAVFLAASVAQLLLQTSIARDASILSGLGSPVGSMLTDTEWGALWTLILTSHGAATAGIRWATLSVDYIPLVASAFWVGALFHLALGIPLVFRSLTPDQRTACLSAILPRFSVIAALSVVVLIATGLFSAWAQVTILPALETPYGLTLLVKLTIVIPILALGPLNLIWVRPNLSRRDHVGSYLRWFVLSEAVLAVLLLASVGVLTSLEPARQVAGREGKGVYE